MPAQDSLWLHDPKVLAPTCRPEVAKPDSEDPIRTMEAGMRVGAQGDLELMPEEQVLEREVAARSNGSNDGMKNKEE